MAEGKKSFVLYSDSQSLVNQLPDDVAGRLFKHIYAYVNDENPITEELILKVAFEPIKMQLKRDLNKWENQIEQRRQAGLRSAEVRKQNATSVNERSIPSTVNDNVSVNVNDILLTKETKVDWEKLREQFNEITGKKSIAVNEKTKKQILSRLKEGYTKQSIVDAITNCYNDEYHIETGHKYLTLEFISRPDKMEKFSTMQEFIKKPKINFREDKI